MSALKVTSSSPLEDVDSLASDPACAGAISPGANVSNPVSPNSLAATPFEVTRFFVAFLAAFLVARFLAATSAVVEWSSWERASFSSSVLMAVY